MVKNFTIFGERCSGTNYLEQCITSNFDVNIVWNYGWKHFFGFDNYNNSDDVLFICIVRDPFKWINSLYREKYHIPNVNKNNINNFLYNEFWSVDKKKEIMKDRNIYTGNRYKNIFELRYIKIAYLLDTLPKLVKNYIFIRYEDLTNDFYNTIEKIKLAGDLKIKDNIKYPINIITDSKTGKKFKVKNNDYIDNNKIINHPNFSVNFEKKLGYL